jgi:hypothetical protein
MTWYAAELTFRGTVLDDPKDEPLYETSIRLVQADSDDEAKTKAAALGNEGAHEYLNPDGERVAWHFLKVGDVQEIEDQTLAHGAELFSRISREI